MKTIILLLCLISFAPFAVHAQWIRHKSEAKLAQMTPAQHVDEWVKEQRHHRFYLEDEQGELIRKYIMLDGTKAVPRLTEYINQYNPLPFRKVGTKQHVKYEACEMMLDWIDNFAVRLRASEEGRRAINALERSVERMNTAGYAVKNGEYSWTHSFIEVSKSNLKEAKGINSTDDAIKDSFRLEYEIVLSEADLLDFSNYLTDRYPEYPSWSERMLVKDDSQLNGVGVPVQIVVLKKPERYYEAYLEFKKTK